MPTRGKVPQIFQLEAVECGAASLAMVLASFGKWLPLEHVREKCGVSRDGSDAYKMVAAAQHYGLRVKTLQKEPEDLAKLPMPQILYWEFNHFVVLTAVKNDRFYINDPAIGSRILEREEVSKGFTGLTLCFATAEDFVAEGKQPSLLNSLRQRIRGLETSFGLLILLNLLLTIPGLLMAGLARVFLDDYIQAGQQSWLWALLAAMILGSALSLLISVLQQGLLLRLRTRLAVAESVAYVWKILHLPFLFFSQRSPAELVQRVRLNNQVANSLTGPLAEIYLSALNMAIYLSLMALYDWVVATASLAFIIFLLYMFRYLNERMRRQHQQLQILRGQAYATAVQGLDQFESYRAQGAEHLFMSRWLSSESAVLACKQSTGVLDNILEASPVLVRGLLLILILILSAERAMTGDISFGTLISMQLLAGLLLSPISILLQNNGLVQQTAGALLRLDDLRNYPASSQVDSEQLEPDIAETQLPENIDGALEIRNLSYGYQPDENVLHDISVSIHPGTITGIVGASGSGKSTLAKCIVGLLQPNKGEILLEGLSIDRWPGALRRNLMGYVEQNGGLMTGDISENLTLWQSDISAEDILTATQDASIHDVIVQKPLAYKTKVSGRNHAFSGGEMQRLTLARALALAPPVLILDEATSALDNISEAAVLEALASRGVTILLVTHRPSSISYCEDIVFIEDGRITQTGKRKELMRHPGPLRAMLGLS